MISSPSTPACSAELVNVLDASDTVTVSGGQFTVEIQGGMPKIYHPVTGHSPEEEGEGEERGEGTDRDKESLAGESNLQYYHLMRTSMSSGAHIMHYSQPQRKSLLG